MISRRQMMMMLEDNNPWRKIQKNVRAGNASQMYAIGDEFASTYLYKNKTYACPWIVLDNDRECEWEDGTVHPGLWLGMKYCVPEQMVFDAKEGVAATEETAQAGFYYVGVSGSTYTMLSLATGATIPYSDYNSVLKGIFNNRQPYKSGLNRWRDSAVRQWLNSAGGVGEWWTSTHFGDNQPAKLSTVSGFVGHLPDDFLSVVTPVKIKTALCNYFGSQLVETTIDRFFLQSQTEVYGLASVSWQEEAEGPYFPYWKNATGYSEPINGTSSNTSAARQIRRIDSVSGSPSDALLRTPSVSGLDLFEYIHSDGRISFNSATYASARPLPACVIS